MTDFQPKWTQTGKTPGSHESIVYRSDRGEQCGQRVVGITPDGVEASVPHCPYINMLDPAGNVCAVVVSPNRDLAQADQRYRHVAVTIKQRKGWQVWDYDRNMHLGFTEEAWNVEREKMRDTRRAGAARASARFNGMGNDKVATLLETVANDHAAIAKVVARLEQGDMAGAERVANEAKGKR